MRSNDNEIVKSDLSNYAFLPFGQMKRRTRNFSFFIVALLFFSGFSTYFILLNLTPVVPTKEVVVTVLLINAILVIVMMAIILIQVRRLFIARSKRMAGAQLHIKLVSLFSAIAAFPLILMAIFASFSLDQNLDHWFSKPIKNIVRSSIKVASKYVVEKGATLGINSKNMAKEFSDTRNIVKTDPKKFTRLLKFLGPLHNIDSSYLIDSLGNVIASHHSKDKLRYEFPNQTIFNLANANNPVVILPIYNDLPPQNNGIVFYMSQNNDGIIRSLIKLKKLSNIYLYTQSKLDVEITNYIAKTRGDVFRYSQLRKRKGGYQVAFAMMYIVVALTLLLAVVWVGFWFADKLVDPIRRLIAAAKKVSDGNLSASVSVSTGQGELADLGTMFNNMTEKLRLQRNELTDATVLINERRRFTEAVLSGVSAGVIGLNANHVITLINRSASQLLPGMKLEYSLDEKIDSILPEFARLVLKADKKENKQIQDNINLVIDNHDRSFAVQVTLEQTGEAIHGYVITFDDITELQAAQKTAAWAEVAQRIAHEIKNPLTPIQLSTDQLKHKFAKVVDDEKGLFVKYTDTINRHVGKIRRRVSEFKDFAEMTELMMSKNDIRQIVNEGMGVFSEDIDYEVVLPDHAVYSMCNSDKLEQTILNLVKNASEAIELRRETEKDEGFEGKIKISLVENDSHFVIQIVDNGCGLPEEKRNTLFDPYVTTRAEGTGLGLAIVKKIIEQHNGTIKLYDANECDGEDKGTCLKIVIPRVIPKETNEKEGKQAEKANTAKPRIVGG